MLEACERPEHVGAWAADGGVVLTRDEVTADAGRDVDQNVGTGGANQLHGLPEQLRVTAGLPRAGIADMQVNYRGAGLGSLAARVGDFARRDGHARMLARGVAPTRDR